MKALNHIEHLHLNSVVGGLYNFSPTSYSTNTYRVLERKETGHSVMFTLEDVETEELYFSSIFE